MRPFLFPTFLGRSWTVRNESCRPDDEVLALLRFVLDRTGGLSARGAIQVRDAGRRTRGNYSGVAGSRKLGHSIPAWVSGRARYYMRLTLPLDDWRCYGLPEVCGHSTELRRLMGEVGSVALTELLEEKLARGETKLGRWPIYRLHDWREVLVNLGAHEAAHLVQYDRDRGHSEVWCEEFAVQTLEAFRAARSCGDEPDASAVNGSQTPSRSPLLGLVTGPATADPTPNRKEPPTVATTTTSPQKADPKDLFATLLDEATKVADKTAKVEKAAYVRVDVLLDDGKKHKTLAYLNNPTSKAVRVEVPKKNGGGYDVIRVEAKKDITTAMKAIRANHERIVAATAETAAA